MEWNKDEARRAMDVAEKKLSMNDYFGAKKFVNKAQNLYPELDGLKQVLTMIHVYISASKKTKGEADWYGVLGVDPLADDEAVKKQYKKLVLLLHPDKNKCNGAEEAFKLVSEAWCLLSDKAKRIAYDQKWKTNTGMQRPPNPHKPRSNTPAPADWSQNNPSGSNKPKPPPADWSQKHVGMFWTMCNECKTQCRLVRDHRLNKVILCPNCGQSFTATEITQWSSPQQQQQRSAETKARNKTKKFASGSWINVSPATSKTQKTPHDSAKSQATNNNTNEASSSSSPSASKTPKTPQESSKSQEATNNNTNGASSSSPSVSAAKTQPASFASPVINVSSSTQPQQQWSTQNQTTSQNTSGSTYSEKTSTVSFSFHCSVSANQSQERLKRAFEESQETTILKKQRTYVK